MHKLRLTLQVLFSPGCFWLASLSQWNQKNRQIWPPKFHPDPRPPQQEVLVTRPWRINNTEELRQYIIHPLGSFSKILPRCCRGGFLCLLEIRRKKEEEEEKRGKIWAAWQLPSPCITHTAVTPTALCRHSSNHRQQAPSTHTHPLTHPPPQGRPTRLTITLASHWQLSAQPKPPSPTPRHFLGCQSPKPRRAAEKGRKCPETRSKPSCTENLDLVGGEILPTNFPRGPAAGEDPAAGNSPLSTLSKEWDARLEISNQFCYPSARTTLACAWVTRHSEHRHYWERWAAYEEEENGDRARNSKEQSSPRELGARLCGKGRRHK